jgi:PAS domain S-box-containing protein
VGVVVAGTVVLGVLGVVAVLLIDSATTGRHAVSVQLGHRWLLVVLLAATALGELVAVPLRHGDELEELTLFEAAVLADALLLRPREAVVVTLLALLVASLVVRRPWVKALFNLGTYGVGAAALVGCVALFGDTGGFHGGTVGGLLLGTAMFATVNLCLLSLVLSAASAVPVAGTLREGWRLSLVMAVGTAGIGATTVAVAHSAPLLLPFSLLPAAALTYAYGAVAQEHEQRLRSAQLLGLSHLLAGSLEVEDLVTSFLAFLREAFRAETAFVILETAGREETVVIADARGVTVRAARPAERALLATAQGTALVEATTTPHGPGRLLVSPLDADGRRLGVVALSERPAPHRRLSFAPLTGTRGPTVALGPAEETLIGPLASALAVALRGAEHLARVVEETGKLKHVVEHSSDGIVVLDDEGTVTVWSPAMEQLSGTPQTAVVGRRMSDVLVTRDDDGAPLDVVRTAFAALAVEQTRITVETQLIRPDGEERLVRWSHAAVFADGPDSDGELLRDVVLVHDVTRERAVDRLKQDFIATVSHELRSPLTPIKGYVDLLRRKGEEFSPEKRRECLDIVNDRVAHLTRIVEDVLLASRVAVPASTVQMTAGDLALLTRRACGDFAVDAGRLRLDIPDEPVAVHCDPVRVVQVAANLVSNALKYSGGDTSVDVRVRTSPGGTAELVVTDGGRGIPADQLDAVFEKFHRVEDPMRMTTGGTGLGLYIARQLAEAMGGSLRVASTYGSGSTFTFTLGAAETEAIQTATPWPVRRYGRPPMPMPRPPGDAGTAGPLVCAPSPSPAGAEPPRPSDATPKGSQPRSGGSTG